MSSLVFRLCENAPDLLREVFLERGWKEFQDGCDGDWNLWWKSCGFRGCDFDHCKPWQRLNHFPKSGLITRKDSLARNLRRMRGVYGSFAYNFSPLSFILPNDYTKFVREYSKQLNSGQKLFWICKPVDLSRGRGIFIFKDLKELTYDCATVVQKYITNPFLVSGYKLDLRLYVLVPSFNPLLIYIYHEGLVRFGTEKFDLTKPGNVFSHLTNTSINKLSPSYSFEKERVGSGCKWSLSQLRTYFHQLDVDDTLLWHRINALIVLTLLNQAPEVPDSCPNSFELFGFDVLIDENLKPWLLEVNFSPSLGYDCPLDATIKKPMINDIIDLLGFREVDACKFVNTYPSEKACHTERDEQCMPPRLVKNCKQKTDRQRLRAFHRKNSKLENNNTESDNDSNPPGPETDTDNMNNCSTSLLDISDLSNNVRGLGIDERMTKSCSMDMLHVNSVGMQNISHDYVCAEDPQSNRPKTTPETSSKLGLMETQPSCEFVKVFVSRESTESRKSLVGVKNNGGFSQDLQIGIKGDTEKMAKQNAKRNSGDVLINNSTRLGRTRHPSLEQISSARFSSSPRLLKRKISLPPKLKRYSTAASSKPRPLLKSSRKDLSNRQRENSGDENPADTTIRVLSRSYVNAMNSSNRFVKKPISQAGNYILAFPFNDVTVKSSKGLINTKTCVEEVKRALNQVFEATKKMTKSKTSGSDSTLDLSKPFWGFRPIYNFGIGT